MTAALARAQRGVRVAFLPQPASDPFRPFARGQSRPSSEPHIRCPGVSSPREMAKNQRSPTSTWYQTPLVALLTGAQRCLLYGGREQL